MARASQMTDQPHRRARHLRRSGALAVAIGVAVVLTGCNPAPGQGSVKVTGNVNAETRGPTVTCPKPSGGVTQVTWQGLLAGKTTTLTVFSGIEGDLDGIQFTHNGKTYQRLDHDLREVDEFGVIHIDQTAATTANPPKTVRIVAALHCP